MIEQDPDVGPTMVRLAWHSSGTYDAISKTGGSGGGTIRFKEELAHGGNAGLAKAEKVSVSAFCRRRLPVILVRLKMAQSVKEAVSFVERGDVRVGPTVITDSAFLVTRSMEDFVTWAGDASQRRHIAKYNNKLDDFDLLQL